MAQVGRGLEDQRVVGLGASHRHARTGGTSSDESCAFQREAETIVEMFEHRGAEESLRCGRAVHARAPESVMEQQGESP